MNMTYAKLKGKIVEKYGTQDEFRKQVGLSKTSMSNKMTGKTGFSQSDIMKWCQLLDIDLNEVGLFFYS